LCLITRQAIVGCKCADNLSAALISNAPVMIGTEISGNWRVTFRFDNGDAIDVDYVAYHQGG